MTGTMMLMVFGFLMCILILFCEHCVHQLVARGKKNVEHPITPTELDKTLNDIVTTDHYKLIMKKTSNVHPMTIDSVGLDTTSHLEILSVDSDDLTKISV